MNIIHNSYTYSKILGNLESALNPGKSLPSCVFSKIWESFYFFDSDLMFEVDFLAKISALLCIEGGSCAGVFKLDGRANESENDSFFITSSTTSDAYQARLLGGGPGDGWIYEMSRFGCVSDVGSWCIYCERSSELGIIGFQKNILIENYNPVLDLLQAGRVSEVVKGCAVYQLSDHVISPNWKKNLLRHYG